MLGTNTMEIENKLTAWLNENDPLLIKNNVRSQADISESITATSPEQSTNIAVSSAVVVGDNKYWETDSEIKTALDKKNRDEALKIFKANPLSGCTTILDMARITSGYDPNGDITEANKDNYLEYLKKVYSCPLIHLNTNMRETYNRKETSWEDAISQIAELFTGIADSNKDKIKRSIKNLANAAASHSNTAQGTSIFSVSAINTSKNNVEIYIYHSNISLCENKSKGSDCKQTSIDIIKAYCEFRSDMWATYAEMIFNKHYEAVNNWINDNSTQNGDVKTNLCVGGYTKI